jgi:hypothetical protein
MEEAVQKIHTISKKEILIETLSDMTVHDAQEVLDTPSPV